MKSKGVQISSKFTLSMRVGKVTKLCNGPLERECNKSLPEAKSLRIRVITLGLLESDYKNRKMCRWTQNPL